MRSAAALIRFTKKISTFFLFFWCLDNSTDIDVDGYQRKTSYVLKMVAATFESRQWIDYKTGCGEYSDIQKS